MCLVQVHLPFPPLQLLLYPNNHYPPSQFHVLIFSLKKKKKQPVHSVLPVCTWVLGLSPAMASLSKAASYKNADSQIWGFFLSVVFPSILFAFSLFPPLLGCLGFLQATLLPVLQFPLFALRGRSHGTCFIL